MKTLTQILILFGLLGCGQVKREIKDQTINMESLIIEKEIVQHSFEDIVPPIQLPDGFQLDSIQKNDTARNLSIFISIPVSGVNQIDKVVFDGMEKQKNDFIESLDEIIKEDNRILSTIKSDFRAEPISVFKDNKVTSILYIVSYYHSGAAHPMTMYYSFNFDNTTQERIFFSDYFAFKNKIDTTLMIDQITKAIGREGIYITDLNDIDFNIEMDTISFNFGNYEIASYVEGIIQGRIQKHKLNDKIKTTYH